MQYMVKSCLNNLSFMSKKCNRLRWATKAYCVFLMRF